MQYRVVSSGTFHELEKQVNDLLQEGWRCQGGFYGVPYNKSEGLRTMHQAMVLPTYKTKVVAED